MPDDSHIHSENDEGGEPPLDPAVTPELFLEWRSPRVGKTNPERMNNPVWEWLVKTRVNAWQANNRLNGPSAFDAGPCWCCDRFGQSSTKLSDGRIVMIGGEHEDYYDPDFFIYNDVIVRHPGGAIDIFGYPGEIFPPTDFHSATLVGERIIIIGNLGYGGSRRHGFTPVLQVDLRTFTISTLETTGLPPGWISRHSAALSEDGNSILVQGGELDRGEDNALVDNIDDWRLHLAGLRWERLTDRRWPRFMVLRKDGGTNHFWQMQTMLWARKNRMQKLSSQQDFAELTKELGAAPDPDLFARLYKPDVPHEDMPEQEDGYGICRIKVAGVIVRYVENVRYVQVTVEGDLPDEIINAMTSDLLAKYSVLENTPCELVRL